MPFARPTLDELRNRSVAQVQSRLGTGPLLPRSVLSVLAHVLAGHSHGLHGHLDWAARQAVPTTADDEGVQAWATMLGLARKQATFASGSAVVTGVNGTVLPIRKRLRRADGAEFLTTAKGTIAGGSAVVPVQALQEGALANSITGVQLTITAPVAGIASTAVVAAPGLLGGAEGETIEDLRQRVLQRTRQVPGAGNTADYVRWSLELAGVTRAWCFARYPGLGSVGVTFATDDDPSGPVPSPAKVAELTAYLEARRPVTADLFVFAPAPLVVNVNAILTPNTPAVQLAVAAELRSLFRRQAAPGQVLYLSHLREAISGAAGEIDHVLVSPDQNVIPQKGQLPVLGSLTFQ